jgi:hypothetical protein
MIFWSLSRFTHDTSFRLRYRTVASEETSVEATTSWLTDIQRESEESIDCPECYDAMIRFYDWDIVRYRCENCDLILKSNENDANNDF